MLNEGFLKAFQHLDSYNDACRLKPGYARFWSIRPLAITAKISRFEQHASLEAGEQVAFDETIVDQIAAEEILALVQQLTPTYRTVFMMHVVDGYSLHEIAGILNHNEATVRSNYARARQKLQLLIKQAYSYKNSGPGASIPYHEN